MGVIRPPWISKEWFSQCPYNYCDHFGNKEELAKLCKICRTEIDREVLYRKQGKDPHELQYVFKDMAKDLASVMVSVKKTAEEMGIDINHLPELEEGPHPDTYALYKLVQRYGTRIEKACQELEIIPVGTDEVIVSKAIDAFAHSRYFVISKISRAFNSKWEEKHDPDDDLQDSKTAAFYAYVAVERNSRAFLTLARHKPLIEMKKKHLQLAKYSLAVSLMIRETFFPDDELEYIEFGYDDFQI